jgi:16S rRNA (adenine1518-N6/adenine1519-N6)-dimethyltransferase
MSVIPSVKPVARKRFGQHFLHDPIVIQRIIRAISPQPSQHLVEIGPGQGALTLSLLSEAQQLDAIELDRDLISLLQQKTSGLGRLNLYQADALKFDWSGLRDDGRRLRLVGNLPYNISTPLLFRLFSSIEHIDDMHFMFQKEVAQRLAADPGEPDYGRLSVMVQYYCQVECLFHVGKGAFTPPPKVESAVVRLIPYRQKPVEVSNEQQFFMLVAQAFSQRRKTLRNSLKPLLSAMAIEAAGIDPGMRPERLSLKDFAALSNIS